MKKNQTLRRIVFLVPFVAFASHAEAIYMVTAKTSQLQELSTSQIKDIYLGVPVFQSGVHVKAIDRKERESRLRERFFKNVVGLNLTQMRSLWSQLIFTGRGYPPPVVDSLDEAVKMLMKGNEFTTFVSDSEFDPNKMKTVFQWTDSK